ncbi:MAG: hypothetical protein HY553_14300 [Elusimicrobia bacterium]|nr:hypothetical protein [Elusimicrobiota bacterium]
MARVLSSAASGKQVPELFIVALIIGIAGAIAIPKLSRLVGGEAEARPVSDLFREIDHGGLLARRRAIASLEVSAPKTEIELERVVGAARQAERKALREAARASLARVEPRGAGLAPTLTALAADPDAELAAAAVRSALAVGVPAADPAMRAAAKRFPALFQAPPPTVAPQRAAEARRRAAAIDAALARVKPVSYPDLLVRAKAAARAGDASAIEALLRDQTFLWGGFQSGRVLATAGVRVLGRAEALARSGDPMSEDVGLGIIRAMSDPAAKAALGRLAKDRDPRIAMAASR